MKLGLFWIDDPAMIESNREQIEYVHLACILETRTAAKAHVHVESILKRLEYEECVAYVLLQIDSRGTVGLTLARHEPRHELVEQEIGQHVHESVVLDELDTGRLEFEMTTQEQTIAYGNERTRSVEVLEQNGRFDAMKFDPFHRVETG